MQKIKNTVVLHKCWLIAIVLLAATSMDASTKVSMTQVVVPASTVTVLVQPSASAFASTTLPLSVMVTSGNGVVIPIGSVTLTDNSEATGSAVVENGIATFAQNSPIGSHQLVACYGGAPNFLGSCSIPISVSVLQPYRLDQTKSSGTVNAPEQFVDDLQVIPTAGFAGVVQLTCQVSFYSCSLSPSSVSFSGNGEKQIVKASFSPAATSTSAGLLGWPIVGLLGLAIKKKRQRFKNIRLVLGSAAFMCLAGCGPVISVPVSSAAQAMIVTSRSGVYSQAVSYQIQVVTDVTQ
jgi:hypothetical protein